MQTVEIMINAGDGLEADVLPASRNEFWPARTKVSAVVDGELPCSINN